MNIKKCLGILVMLSVTACIKAQNRCYVFQHGQFVDGINYYCGKATIMKDESGFLEKSQYQSEKNKLNEECRKLYKGNEKLYKQNPYAELVLPNEVMVVLYCVQQLEIKKGVFCSNTFYECYKGTDGADVVKRANKRMTNVDSKTKCSVFRKIINGENVIPNKFK